MDIFLILGILIGLGAIITGLLIKGVSVAVLLNGEAAIIILVGTVAAVMNAFPKKEFTNIPKIMGALFREKDNQNPMELIELLAEMSQQARRDGLLSLEPKIQTIDNRFIKKGLNMVIDGFEREYIEAVLEVEIESMENRHRSCASIFSTAGSSAPTLGVMGAVIGLIGALGNLEDTATLGESIASAFVATLYGIFVGYVLCHPISTRLKRKSSEEARNMRVVMEGILSIQSGENPQMIKTKLSGMLEPKERKKIEETM